RPARNGPRVHGEPLRRECANAIVEWRINGAVEFDGCFEREVDHEVGTTEADRREMRSCASLPCRFPSRQADLRIRRGRFSSPQTDGSSWTMGSNTDLINML